MHLLWISHPDVAGLPFPSTPDIIWTPAASLDEALEQLHSQSFDAVLFSTEARDALASARRLIMAAGACPVMVQCASLTLGAVEQLAAAGVVHVFRTTLEETSVHTALSLARESRTRASWRKLLIGESRPIREVAEIIGLVASRRCTILITGETGTGKEVVARCVHLGSQRARHEFVAINCGAVPEHLLEAELFGHVKGAFTGAMQQRIGLFEKAQQGTLFLDEIGEMPLHLQAKLLRVLQERELQRLGSSETIKLDVRVIAATNVDLLEKMRQGKFREDLYYRLNVVPISLPSLRERPCDIALLANHFLKKICDAERVPVRSITRDGLAHLASQDWPGNVRQLENAMEMAVALSGARLQLEAKDFPLAFRAGTRPCASFELALPESGLDFATTVGSLERTLLQQALEKTQGNKKMAAEMLRLKRTTLTAKLKSFAIATAC